MAKEPSSDDTPQGAPQETPKDTPTGAANEAGDQPVVPLTVNAQYIKDLSFESPNAPGIFAEMQENPPDINLQINVNAKPVQDSVYEVVLEMQADCKVGEKVGFILELEYAGIFTLNVPEEHLQAVMLVECPRLLFPFARNVLGETTRDGGFPPVMLGPVDFAGMYQAGQKQAEEKLAEDKKTGKKE